MTELRTRGENRQRMSVWFDRTERWLENKLSRVESNMYVRGVIFFALLALITATVYQLNAAMPLIMDDYDFMFSWSTGSLLTGFDDVIRSQIVHYQIWGGRLLHIFTQSFLYLGKNAFNVANTAMFMLLLLEIYGIARPKRCFCWPILLLTYLVLMTMLPFFGTVFLWLTGSCIYLWGTTLALMPLIVLRSVRECGIMSRGRLRAALCLPVGILAGWTNENTTCGIIICVSVFVAYDYWKERRLSGRILLLLLGQCIGAMLLLLAPGNFARASVYTYDSMIRELLRRFVLVTGYGMSYMGVLLAFVLLMSAGLRNTALRQRYVYVLVFASLVSAYAMVGSPELSDRTFTGPFVLMLTALMVIVGDGEMIARKLDSAKVLVLPLAFVMMVYLGYHAVRDVQEYAEEWNMRVQSIEYACEAGQDKIEVLSQNAHSRYTMDIIFEEDAAQWPNSTLSKYYGIEIMGR